MWLHLPSILPSSTCWGVCAFFSPLVLAFLDLLTILLASLRLCLAFLLLLRRVLSSLRLCLAFLLLLGRVLASLHLCLTFSGSVHVCAHLALWACASLSLLREIEW